MNFNSLYIGKVVHDSDLLNEEDGRPYNRVKVYIEGITSADDVFFQQPRGKNNNNRVSSKLLEKVGKSVYAYVMQPVAGSGTGATYNANKDFISVTDSGDIESDGIPPADNYHAIGDGFVGGMGTGTAGVNANANAYSPDNRSNAYKGMMALPGVGATVVVSFLGGSNGKPIIIGVLPSAADVDSIHGLGLADEIYPNYPFAYSNLTEQSEDE